VLRKHLEARGYNQKSFADQARVDQTTISKIARDLRRPSMELFGEMYALLGPVFTLEYLDAIAQNGHS
jgi:transcriptional regulator with XRE-family HTH domain